MLAVEVGEVQVSMEWGRGPLVGLGGLCMWGPLGLVHVAAGGLGAGIGGGLVLG